MANPNLPNTQPTGSVERRLAKPNNPSAKPATGRVNRALEELKIRAKKLLKQSRQDDVIARNFAPILKKQNWNVGRELQLKDCQNLLASKCGFSNWQAARKVLTGGDLKPIGSFWHQPGCDALINQWFASYVDAKSVLHSSEPHYLLPYKNQFVVVRFEYLKVLGVATTDHAQLEAIQRDLIAGFGSEAWDRLALNVLKAKTQLK